MTICADCGATNGDDERFCGTCGAFLAWEKSTGAGTPPAPGPAPDAPRDEGRGPAVDRQGSDGATETDGRSPVDREGSPKVAGEQQSSTVDGDRVPADGALTAVVDRDGGAQPAPLQPRVRKRSEGSPERDAGPVSRVDQAPRPAPAQLACPRCATGNAVGRRFCRACGSPLDAPAGPEPERTWWQRLWDRLRRRSARRPRREARRAAGARRMLLIVIALCVLAVLAVTGPPLVRRAVEEFRDRTQKPDPLVPAAVAASSQRADATAARLTDGANNRYWAPVGQAADAWVEATFAQPVRLLDVVITPGVGLRRQAFLAAGRPRQLTVVTVDADGRQQRTDIELRDTPGEQHFDIEASDVVRVRMVVRSTYGPELVPAVAIAEAEFFGRQ